MINLMPKENQSQTQPNTHKKIGLLVGIAVIVFSACFYLGYLYYKISVNEAKLEQIDLEINSYSTSYRKVKNFESLLQRIVDKNNLKQIVAANYIVPLNALNILIHSKPDSIWFERIQFSGMDGSFVVSGGATNYAALTNFIGQLEQDKLSFNQIKPEQTIIHQNSTGSGYAQFKISGILVRKGEMRVQNN
jgi:Fimbrial assembly protein (PilN).